MNWLLVFISGLITYFLRYSMISLIKKDMLSEKTKTLLGYVPSAVFPALIFPAVLIENSGSDIDFEASSCLNGMRKRGVEIRPVIDYFLKELDMASTYEESSRAIGILQSIGDQSVVNAFIEILNSNKEGDEPWLVAGALGDLYAVSYTHLTLPTTPYV